MIDVTQVLVTAAVSAILPSALAAAFYKLIQRRDIEFDGIKSRVQQLEDEKIKGIQDRLDSGSGQFDEIQKGMCELTPHTAFRDHQVRCDRRFEEIIATQRDLENKVGRLSADVASVKAIVSLIADHMHISIN